MKIFNKVSAALLAVVFALVMNSPNSVFAATTPDLGASSSYAVIGSTYTNTVPGTTITGDIGFTTPPAVVPAGIHNNYGSSAPYSAAGSDQNNALSTLATQACTFTFASGAIDLATDTTHGPIGVYTPGVYCTSAPGAASIGTGGITLSGAGTYIFRINGALTTVANSNVTLAGVSACDVFWTPTGATTLGANSTFTGTDIDASGITVGDNVSWLGRALAFGETVTTSVDDNITVPTCSGSVPFSTPSTLVSPSISVTKTPTLISLSNAGGGLVAFDYMVSNVGTVAMNNITITDNKCSPINFISGDTNNNLMLEVNEIWHYRCTTNVSQTTTNTVTVTGQANGFTATGTANTTVTVNLPSPTTPSTVVTPPVVAPVIFPRTGLPPEEDNIPWNIIVPAGLFGVLLSFYLNKKKQVS